MLRPIEHESKATGQPNLQFTVMNPGRTFLAVRDSREPHYRLVAPLVSDLEWRFTDLTDDPHEKDPIIAFGFREFLHKVEKDRGLPAANWAEAAAFASRFWVEENERRWRYHSSKTPVDYNPRIPNQQQ